MTTIEELTTLAGIYFEEPRYISRHVLQEGYVSWVHLDKYNPGDGVRVLEIRLAADLNPGDLVERSNYRSLIRDFENGLPVYRKELEEMAHRADRMRAKLHLFLVGMGDGWAQPADLTWSTNVDHMTPLLGDDAYEALDSGINVGQFLRGGLRAQSWRERYWPFRWVPRVQNDAR